MPAIRILHALLTLAVLLPTAPAFAAASGWDSHEHGAARLITATAATGSTTRLDVGLQLRLTPGWHTYWRTPGDAGIPPTIDWSGSENLAGGSIAWPAPVRLAPLGGLETVGYENGVVLPITLTLTHPGAGLHLHAEVDYASCKDVCIPYHASLDLVLPPGPALPGAEAALIAEAAARVPADGNAAGIVVQRAAVTPKGDGAVLAVRLESPGMAWREPDVFVEGGGDASFGRPAVALAGNNRIATLNVPVRGTTATKLGGQVLHLTVIDGPRAADLATTPAIGSLPPVASEGTTRAIIVPLALLGGLILNLMPCVLPVLSLKLLSLVGYAGAARRTARLGLLATAAGILASFAALAAALVAAKMAGGTIGWGIQFQVPWFLAAMALAMTLFAASLFDWLAIGLPGRMTSAIGTACGRGPMGNAFLTGALATLLAASCSAPFLGTAIGFALARGPADIVLVFAVLGLGMTAPYLAVATAPGLIAFLPRPGPWMAWLRRALAVALLGTAVWLLAVLWAEAGPASAGVTATALLLILFVLAWRHHRPRRGLAAAAGLLAVLAVLVPVLRPPAAPSPAIATGPWRPFEAAAIPRLVAAGDVVFVDVTAAWCLTCKVNELAVLDRAPVSDRLRDPGTVTLRADWTRPAPALAAYMQSLGRYGVPLDVVYGPGAPQGIVLPELLTQQAVLDAFRRAAPGTAKEVSR
jgi:suppressor for copper-sensitivity B